MHHTDCRPSSASPLTQARKMARAQYVVCAEAGVRTGADGEIAQREQNGGTAMDFMDTQDFSRQELEELLGLIRLLKDADLDAAVPQLLSHRSLGMIFEEPSTRGGQRP
ncbi:MAG: hypothetical protein ACLQBY_01715 [Solirubrobacteraceae bacterium]